MSKRALSQKQFSEPLSRALKERTSLDGEAFKDPEIARNSCVTASDVFLSDLRRHGGRGGMIEVFSEGMPSSHVVNVSEGHVIDWTARQFDPKADVPHIEPVKSYISRFEDVRGRGTAKRKA